jgi:hypothetical protein
MRRICELMAGLPSSVQEPPSDTPTFSQRNISASQKHSSEVLTPMWSDSIPATSGTISNAGRCTQPKQAQR